MIIGMGLRWHLPLPRLRRLLSPRSSGPGGALRFALRTHWLSDGLSDPVISDGVVTIAWDLKTCVGGTQWCIDYSRNLRESHCFVWNFVSKRCICKRTICAFSVCMKGGKSKAISKHYSTFLLKNITHYYNLRHRNTESEPNCTIIFVSLKSEIDVSSIGH